MRVAQLKQILETRGEKCKECVEKGDYIAKIREVFGLAAAPAATHSEL
jgi:hypothetical protein